MSTAGQITGSCKNNFAQFWLDCSGFVKAVAADCGVIMNGNANDIVRYYLTFPADPWQKLFNEKEAVAEARAGKLVIAGMAENGHGHVMVLVDEHNPVHLGRAFGYWGRFHSVGRIKGKELNAGALSLGYGSITAAWRKTDLPKVQFACIKPSKTFLSTNSPGRAYHL